MRNIPTGLQLDRTIPFVNAVFNVLEKGDSEDEAIKILLQAEQKTGTQIIKPVLSGVPDPPDGYKEVIETNFFNFLTETHLVLCPAWEYDKVTLLFPEGRTWTATWRAWGAILAEWANKASWCGFNEWEYVDFYMGNNPFYCIEQYEAWHGVALRIIEIKNH